MPTRRTTHIPSLLTVGLLPTVKFVSDCRSPGGRSSLKLLFTWSIRKCSFQQETPPCESSVMICLRSNVLSENPKYSYSLSSVACICSYIVLPSTPQGQSRRIHIHVEMTDGGSPLQCDHISSVAIGSIYLRTRYEEPLDSWQEQDLDRLRNKWSDALMNRREYLDSEVRKIVNKKGEDGGWGRRREA